MKHDVDYFINKFEAIPSKKIITGWIKGRNGSGCVVGHMNHQEHVDLDFLFKYLDLSLLYCNRPVSINDGLVREYQQPTPQERILAALYDIKKKKSKLHFDITKELAILPIEERVDLIENKHIQKTK